MTSRAAYVVAGLLVLALLAWAAWKWWTSREQTTAMPTSTGTDTVSQSTQVTLAGPRARIAVSLAPAESIEGATA